MPTAVTSFILPDLLDLCPIKGSTNPHYEKAAAESSAWINSYNIFSEKKRAFFLHGYNELLVSHTYPYAGYEQFRTCCDFVNVLFVVDEISDDQSGAGARVTGETFLNAMCHTDWDDGSVIAKITKEFRTRYLRLAGPKSSRRFLKHCEDYIECISREAELREQGEVLDVESFIALRRENSAVRLCFGLFEYCLGIDLPDEVFEDAAFESLYFAACDLICWSNDLYSYDMEQAKGHTGNNILTVLMKARGWRLQEAADYVGEHFSELMSTWTDSKARLPSWGPAVDDDVAQFVMATGHWVRGNLDWSFATQRYFGADHAKIKDTRKVVLRPIERQLDDLLVE